MVKDMRLGNRVTVDQGQSRIMVELMTGGCPKYRYAEHRGAWKEPRRGPIYIAVMLIFSAAHWGALVGYHFVRKLEYVTEEQRSQGGS